MQWLCDGSHRGFTLVETLLTITVLAIISSVVGRILLVGLDTYAAVIGLSTGLQQARGAMNRMTDELVRLPPGGVVLVSDTRLDYLEAGGLPNNFRQEGNGGNPVVVRGDDLLVQNIGYLDFDTWDGLGAPIAVPALVRRINIELNVMARGVPGTITFRTEVFPRLFLYAGFVATGG